MNNLSIPTLIRQIHDLVDENINRLEIEIPSKRWDQLRAAMDLVSDTNDAIEFYEMFDENDKCFEYYLFQYGLLQALFVQQDAVEHLFEALVISCEKNKVLSAIREIRNDVVGHPSQRQMERNSGWRGAENKINPWVNKKKEKQYSNFLVQITLNKKRFSYHTHRSSLEKLSGLDFIQLQDYSEDSFFSVIEVDVLGMIKSQREIFQTELKTLLDNVKKELRNKMSKFQNKSLCKMMSKNGAMSDITHLICNIPDQPQQIAANLSFLQGTRADIFKIKAELEKRNEYNANWDDSINTLLFILDWIEKILNQIPKGWKTQCYVISFSLLRFLSEFYEMLSNLDDEYQNLDLDL